MTLYRIRFELHSAIVTPFKGDTIWGHIVWGIANQEGDTAVAGFLDQAKSDSPALVVSSAFPAGMLCRPLPPPQERDGSLNISRYSELKKDKKRKYLPTSDYFYGTETSIEIHEDPVKSIQVMHNTIDRETNNVLNGGLYTTEEKWYGIRDKNNRWKNLEWDLYILSSFSPDRIKQLVEWAFENGYGADSSTGKGKIEIKDEPVEVKPKKQGNTYMALGPFVNTKNSISNIRADIFIRSGKIGGAFASSLSPYKKPVVLYDEGAVFDCDTSIEYTGKLLEDMHETAKRICQSGFAPVIPIYS